MAGSNKRILIAGDERSGAEGLARALTDKGYEVSRTSEASEVDRQVSSGDVEGLVGDYGLLSTWLPEQGRTVFGGITSTSPTIPLVSIGPGYNIPEAFFKRRGWLCAGDYKDSEAISVYFNKKFRERPSR